MHNSSNISLCIKISRKNLEMHVETSFCLPVDETLHTFTITSHSLSWSSDKPTFQHSTKQDLPYSLIEEPAIVSNIN